MKITNWLVQRDDEGELIARFGQARLVRRLNGRFELVGGSSGDRIAAREWVSLFLHDAVVQELPGAGI